MTNDMVRSYNLESRGTSQGGMSIPGRSMTEILVSSFAKNSKEEVRVSLRDYMGRHVVDLRVYVENGEGAVVPTKKGLTISVEHYRDLRAAIDKLGKVLDEHGMSEQTM
jgi:hypothetical protein